MTLKRDSRPFSEEGHPSVKNRTTKPNALLQKKQRNLLFEDESLNKITFIRQDFFSCKHVQKFHIFQRSRSNHQPLKTQHYLRIIS